MFENVIFLFYEIMWLKYKQTGDIFVKHDFVMLSYGYFYIKWFLFWSDSKIGLMNGPGGQQDVSFVW